MPEGCSRNKWLLRGLGLAGVAALPKCAICVFGYIALATGLMRAAPQLCGANPGEGPGDFWWLQGPLVVGVIFLVQWFRRRMSVRPRRVVEQQCSLRNEKIPLKTEVSTPVSTPSSQPGIVGTCPNRTALFVESLNLPSIMILAGIILVLLVALVGTETFPIGES